MVINGWKRREFTTKGADPTTVVEWSKDGITLQEFQNVYSVIPAVTIDWVPELHKALEEAAFTKDRLDEIAKGDGFEDFKV